MKKIVVLGPESTGKSTLCQQLAEHYETIWCPEFARDYLTKNGMDYSYDDLVTIAKSQLKLEDELVNQAANEHYFIDTDMHVMKVWCEVAFNRCHTWILKQAARRHYDLFLLCKPDMPWVADELREYPDLKMRERLFKMYRELMINGPTPWAEISGSYDQRLQQATTAVDAIS